MNVVKFCYTVTNKLFNNYTADWLQVHMSKRHDFTQDKPADPNIELAIVVNWTQSVVYRNPDSTTCSRGLWFCGNVKLQGHTSAADFFSLALVELTLPLEAWVCPHHVMK
jgi:hypothetical protein